MMKLIWHLGKWLHEWPCEHGYHEWDLYRPGNALWWKSCKHCHASRHAMHPARAECDIDYYNNVYLPQHRVLYKGTVKHGEPK